VSQRPHRWAYRWCEASAETKFEATKVTGCTSCTDLTTLAAAVEKTYDGASNLFYCEP
jgi:hypothetical protein